MSRIYVASSWRCPEQPAVVEALRGAGHEVYDFRNPPGRTGFAWSEIDREWLGWSPEIYRGLLDHPTAVAGYQSDFDAMEWADTFVLVLPCGRSAHLELGWAAGQGKRTAILLSPDKFEPELMYRMVDKLATSIDELLDWLNTAEEQAPLPPPRHRYEGRIEVSGQTPQEVSDRLANVDSRIFEKLHRRPDDPIRIYSGQYSIEVDVDPTMTEERFDRELREWAQARRKAAGR